MSFTIYSKPGCSFCEKAKDLLKSKQLEYSEVIIDVGQKKEDDKKYITVDEIRALIPGVTSVPQIFKDGTLLGGYEALRASL